MAKNTTPVKIALRVYWKIDCFIDYYRFKNSLIGSAYLSTCNIFVISIFSGISNIWKSLKNPKNPWKFLEKSENPAWFSGIFENPKNLVRHFGKWYTPRKWQIWTLSWSRFLQKWYPVPESESWKWYPVQRHVPVQKNIWVPPPPGFWVTRNVSIFTVKWNMFSWNQ